MIKNERQYKITRSQADKFSLALKKFDELSLIEQGYDPVLIRAQRSALESQLRTLKSQIESYEKLKSGSIRTLSTGAISDLGRTFIEARIAQQLTQAELAARLNMKEQQIQRYEKEQYASANLERIAEIADALDVALQFELNLSKAELEKPRTIDLSSLPVKQIKKLGWLNKFLAKHSSLEDAVSAFIEPVVRSASPALLRQGKRLNSELDDYALLAWKARVSWKARDSKVTVTPNFGDLSWMASLKDFTYQKDGPALAIEYLKTKGITVVIEKHLPKTHLDGAALLVDDRIFTIALTLRHDRLDNFWFVLLHELGHIVQHRDSGLRAGFFDDDDVDATEQLEKEADEFAKSILLPAEVWLSSFVRFTQSEQQIVDFAKENHISAAIIAGWIRRQRSDYTIFKNLVGHGKVRNLLRDAGLLEEGDA